MNKKIAARVCSTETTREYLNLDGNNDGGRMDIPSFTLTLKKCQDIFLPDWPLHVTDDRSVWVIHELYANLCDTSTRTSPTEDLKKS